MSFYSLKKMKLFAIVLLFACSLVVAQPPEPLLSQRMAALQVWVSRAASPVLTGQAYSQYSDPAIVTHTVRDVGSFGPGAFLAAEYDGTLFVPGVYGVPSLILRPTFDPSTLRWIDQDTVQVDYVLNVSALYNPTLQQYTAIANGLRFRDIFVFVPNTSLVKLDYGIQDPYGARVFEADAAAISPEQLCGLLFFACTRTPEDYAAMGFTDFPGCVAFASALINGPPSVCPFPFKSNTTFCRILHGISSIELPSVHCPHVRPFDSMVCRDQCLPACNGCSANAHCTAVFPNIFTTQYKCTCNDGYTGDGYTCTANTCTTANDCNDNPNQLTCTNGICKCRPSFTWNSTNTQGDVCQCVDGRVYSNGSNGPVCIPTGRCIQDNQCQAQNPETVKCVQYEPVTQYSPPFGACKCNYGYQGGWEYPCSCPAPKREVNSISANGKICIAANECTEDRHCPQPNGRCQAIAGAPVGTCA